jgi:sugar/nucleoside kinase (ribokinase family)
MSHLAIYGHVNLDRIYRLREQPKANTTVEVTDSETRYGGTAGNIAAVAARLGTRVKLASFIGHDFPDAYRKHLQGLGVDTTELILKNDYSTPTFWGFTDPEGNVLGIIDQGPMRDILNFELLTDCLEDAHAVHFCTGRPAYYQRIAEHAKRKNVPILLDPGQELRALYEPEHLEDLLEAASYYVVNHHEMEETLEKFGYGAPHQLFDHELDAIIETRSADGTRLYTEDQTVEVPAVRVPAEKVIDPIGAGDAFRGGFHAARENGKDLIEAVCWGNAAAALVIQQPGGQSHLPTKEQVEPLAEELEPRGLKR